MFIDRKPRKGFLFLWSEAILMYNKNEVEK